MNDRQEAVLELCESAIVALENPGNDTFSDAMTHSLIAELKKMAVSLDPEEFSPTFGRALLEYDGQLAEQIMNAEYQYNRIRKKNRLREGRPAE